MTSPWRARALAFALAAAVYLLDRWIKGLVLGAWDLREVGQIYVLPFFNLTWTQNFGVSFGQLAATSPEMRWGLVALTGGIAMVVLVWLLRERTFGEMGGLALILGGALGNIHDRIRYGYVIDYADLHIGGFRPFLIFNVADAAITIGVLIILARALFMREKPARPQDEKAADPPAETI